MGIDEEFYRLCKRRLRIKSRDFWVHNLGNNTMMVYQDHYAGEIFMRDEDIKYLDFQDPLLVVPMGFKKRIG